MDVSLLVSLVLGLPAAVLATLKIIDWWKKRRAIKAKAATMEQDATPLNTPAGQGIAPIIRQVEIAAEVDRQIAEDLRRYDVEQRSREPKEEAFHRIG
jgi:hypothetical protein